MNMASVKWIAALAVASGLVTGIAKAEEATSLYGCTGLAEAADPQVVEGAEGFFFTIMDDIAMQSVADPALVENISNLAKQLREKGTILVYAPLPSRSQVLFDKVPQSAWIYGYDEAVNTEIYKDAVARLEAAHVAVVDLLTPMRNSSGDMPPFQKADPMWTTAGARLAASAIVDRINAMPEARKANLMTFTTTEGEQFTRRSSLREAIQAHCSETLPPVTETRFETTGHEAFASDRPFNILGSEAPAPVVLVGSRFSADGQSHFDGFLQQLSGMKVDNRATAEGSPFASITQYLASPDFKSGPPLFLIWEVAPGSNLANFGPEPWEKLQEDIEGACDDCAGEQQ